MGEKSSGKFPCSSDPMGGTNFLFKFFLSIVFMERDEQVALERAVEAYWKNGLLEEDQKKVREVIFNFLISQGFNVTKADVWAVWTARPSAGYKVERPEIPKNYNSDKRGSTLKRWTENLPIVRDKIRKVSGRAYRPAFEEAREFLPEELARELSDHGYILDFPLLPQQRVVLRNLEDGNRLGLNSLYIGESLRWDVQYWIIKTVKK